MEQPLTGRSAMRFWAFALSLMACTTENPGGSISLIQGKMRFDPTASEGFLPSPTYQKQGDTAVFRDYFALANQPEFQIKARLSGDTLYFEYQTVGDVRLDWMPTVEAEMRMHLEMEMDSVWVHFPTVVAARMPSVSEKGFRDARSPLLVRVGL